MWCFTLLTHNLPMSNSPSQTLPGVLVTWCRIRSSPVTFIVNSDGTSYRRSCHDIGFSSWGRKTALSHAEMNTDRDSKDDKEGLSHRALRLEERRTLTEGEWTDRTLAQPDDNRSTSPQSRRDSERQTADRSHQRRSQRRRRNGKMLASETNERQIAAVIKKNGSSTNVGNDYDRALLTSTLRRPNSAAAVH